MKKGKSETIDITRLRLCDFNPNQMPKNIFDHLKKTISERGFMQPLTVALLESGEYKVIDGHHRLKACKELGWTEIPCYVISDKTEGDIKIDLINMNRTRGEFDHDKYQALVKSLAEEMDTELIRDTLNLEETFQFDEELPEPEQEFNPEGDAKYKIVKGEIFQLGKNRLMCGDSTDENEVKLLLEGNKADMVFTDPPYGVGYEKKVKSKSLGKKTYCKISGDKNLKESEIIWESSFKNIRQNLKEGGAYYVCAPQGGDQMMMMMMMKGSIPCKHELIWIKNAPSFSMGRLDYDYQHEPILYGWVGSHEFMGQGEHTKSIWQVDRERKCDLHPTMKPVKLILNAILNSSKKEEVILDLFGGSGSTLIAAQQSNRRCFMMEIDSYYCSIIIERWEKYTGKKAEKLNGK